MKSEANSSQGGHATINTLVVYTTNIFWEGNKGKSLRISQLRIDKTENKPFFIKVIF